MTMVHANTALQTIFSQRVCHKNIQWAFDWLFTIDICSGIQSCQTRHGLVSWDLSVADVASKCGDTSQSQNREHARMWHKQCRRWITRKEVIIIYSKTFRDTNPTAVYSPDKIILLILCSVDTEVDIKKIRHERDYVRVVIMRQYETRWPAPGVQEIVIHWVWRRVRVAPTACPGLGYDNTQWDTNFTIYIVLGYMGIVWGR